MAPEIVLGVTGSVAAFRAADLAGRLREAGFHVAAVLTAAATRFISPMQMEALCDRGAYADLWERPMSHIELARADLILVAPATANIIGKAAAGIGDDLLSTVLLAATGPCVFAPAMNWRMYQNTVVRRNLGALEERGALIVPPTSGMLACGEEGEGRLADTDAIVFSVRRALAEGLMAKRRVIVTSGPTREPIDPVRFISNRSSGRMGHAIAAEAAVQGADVTLISGPVGIATPPGVRLLAVETAAEMGTAVKAESRTADVLVMAAAVGDFRPQPANEKLSRSGARSILVDPTEDILGSLDPDGAPAVRVGFSAELGARKDRAREKCRTKGLDLIVFNDLTEPGAGFDVETNAVTLIHRDGRETRLDTRPKTAVAEVLVREVAEILARSAREKNS